MKEIRNQYWLSNLLVTSKKIASSGTRTCIFSANSCCTQNPKSLQYNWTLKTKELDNVKTGNLKKKKRDHKEPKQDEDTSNLLHFRYLF